MKEPKRVVVILAFAAIYIIWGSTYLAIAYAIDTIPPFLMAGTRFIITSFILLIWMYIKKIPFPSLKQMGTASISGILMFVGGNVSVVWAEKYISSGVAAVIIASVPIWFVILDLEQLKKLRTNFLLSIGLVLGFVGVIILVGVKDMFQKDISSMVLLSYGLIIIATITWVLGTLYTRKANHPTNVTAKVMSQTLSAGIVTIILSAISGEFRTVELSSITFVSYFSLGYLIVFGTVIAYYSYIWLIQIKPAAQVGTYTYVNPIIAVLLGWWLRDEIISPNIITGLFTILASIFIINYSFLKYSNQNKRVLSSKN
ncbi:MAG: EamA family transporter [Cyclobacteriaceae bacterium]|nr:EamA family transporter [Cyclobacteriaceae bacterium]